MTDVKTKAANVVRKNEGLIPTRTIANFFNGDTSLKSLDNIDVSLFENFKYAPLTSVEVERSFSSLCNLLTRKRMNLSFEALQNHLVIQFNQKTVK